MQKMDLLLPDSLKEKLYRTILSPLKEENFSEEYDSLFKSMVEFHRRFCSLEAGYAQVYARVVAVEQQLTLQ